MSGKIVAVALSGGVDSAVCAALLLEQGYQVLGVTMHLTVSETSTTANARSIASKLGIPHYVVDFSTDFEEKVIAPFCQQYIRGQTPNPCVLCNQNLKFGLLLEYAGKIGANLLATGHYARIKETSSGHTLCKAYDSAKDQTYFLYTLNKKVLPSLLFPIGELLKKDVALLAKQFSLPVSTEEESHDVCFIAGANYRTFLGSRLFTPPGKVYDINGKEIGNHSGISNYTIGQRQGLNLGQAEKLYVISIDCHSSSIVVGPEKFLMKKKLTAGSINWVSGFFPHDNSAITAKIRYGSIETPVTLMPYKDKLSVFFDSPAKAVTPGQSIVFYSGEKVLGGGIILS